MNTNTYMTAEFSDLLNKVGNVNYDINKSFTQYAGFLEGLMGGMFYELNEEQKKYYLKRAKDKLMELEAERYYKELNAYQTNQTND